MIGSAEVFLRVLLFRLVVTVPPCSVPLLCPSAINTLLFVSSCRKTDPLNKGTVGIREVVWEMEIRRTNRSGGMTKGGTEGVQECDDCVWN
jgi:hypothetical protein